MVNDGDTSPHHDSHQPVHLADIQCKITCTGATLCALIATLSPPPMQTAHPQPTTPTMTMAISMDNDDGPYHDDHWQPMNLLGIQQEIQQTMISMQAFFDTLVSPSEFAPTTMAMSTIDQPQRPASQ